MSVFTIGMAGCGVATIACVYMLFRNNWVLASRIDMLFSDKERYQKLPSYDRMLWRYPLTWSVEEIERKAKVKK
jgi:hypothetical protein